MFKLYGRTSPLHPEWDEMEWLITPDDLVEIPTIEMALGLPKASIRPGEQKYVLMDGLTCYLALEADLDGSLIEFNVPVRVAKDEAASTSSRRRTRAIVKADSGSLKIEVSGAPRGIRTGVKHSTK